MKRFDSNKKKAAGGPRFFKPAAKPKSAPVRELTIDIARLSDEGRGVGFAQGKAIFVPCTLPGERAQVRVLDEKRTVIDAELIELLDTAPARIEPHCGLFGRCGGCQLQMLDDAAQLDHKRQVLERLLAPFAAHKHFAWGEAITASAWHYRHRARLAVTTIDGKPAIGFKGNNSHQVVAVAGCPILDERLQPLLQQVPQWLARLTQWRRLEEILIAVDAEGTLAIDWNAQRAFPKADAELLASLAQQAGVVTGSQALLVYRSPGAGSEFHYTLRDFTQINPAINDALTQRVMEWLSPGPADAVADLFCGLGNFVLPLAKCAQSVDGFESSATMVERAIQNAARAAVENARFSALDLFENADQLGDAFDKVLLDPPRAGAKAVCERMAKFKRLQRIVYVSCNPQTLVRDLELLAAGGFVVERAGLVDMFPQTGHCEAVVRLSRR
jgi:23S rRNA (uracil1939-C5)-methyltransferase